MVEMMPSHLSSHRGHFIGLDIGSNAVRAAELTVKGHQPTLQRFAQVELPPGAVADGEIVDATAVGVALKQLWVEGRFSHKRVVVGVSSQRAIVRLADVPAMTDAELRTALKFEAEDLIPIPVEEAVLDFSTIDPRMQATDPSEPPKMRILLVAAQRDMVNGHLGALKAAGLKPVAVDPVALALLRAVPAAPGHPDAAIPVTEAVIAIGAGSTTVAIRENGIPRFVRVLNIGGDDLVAATSDASPVATQQAPRGAAATASATAVVTVRSAVGGPMRALVDDIRGSLDFYLAQADTDRVDRIVATGGAALTEGLLPRLQDALRQTVEVANPLETIAVAKTGLTEEQLQQAVPYLVAPIGLALWGTAPGRQISLLPDEVFQAVRHRRQAVGIVAAVTAFALMLGLGWTGRTVQVKRAQHDQRRAEAQSTSLQRQLSALSDVTAVESKVKSGQDLYSAVLAKDVDWIRLVEQVTAVMPSDVHLTTLSVSRTAGSAVGAASSLSTADGAITFNGIARGGPDSVANWLRALETLPGLSGATVQTLAQTVSPSGSKASTGTTFSSTANVTSAAASQRAAQGKAK